jgi:hypothetical protein
LLARTRAWVETQTDQVIIVVCLGLGSLQIGSGVYQIVS